MDILKGWIISICTTVFFITAVEMILPNNKLKKYAKFVLGLILITVLISPIIKLFDKNYDIDVYANKAVKYFDEKGYENKLVDYKEDNIKNTVSNFKLNLEKTCEKMLLEKYPNNNYKVEANVSYDKDKQTVVINHINVGIKNGKVEKVKKIEISTKGSYENYNSTMNDERARLLKDYLSKELKVSNEVIVIYKL
jgi:stage III sporulation protein AF